MTSSLTTRTPSGLTNAAPWQTMGDAGIPDPSWALAYHNDFTTYAPADWTVTEVGGDTTQALAATEGGALLLTNTAGATDATYMQQVAAAFKLRTGKAAFFKFAGTLSEATNNTFYCGLIATSATPLSANDGLYIVKASGGKTLSLVSKVGGVSTTVAFPSSLTLADATAFELGIAVDAQSNVYAFFNPTTGNNPISTAAGAPRGYVAALYAPGLTQVLLSPSFGLLNASAAARTLSVDFITAVRER